MSCPLGSTTPNGTDTFSPSEVVIVASTVIVDSRGVLLFAKKRTVGPDRKGESTAGAVATKDKKRAVAASRGTSNTR